MQVLWNSLPADEREEIRVAVLLKQPKALAKHPGLVERFCLEELARRLGKGSPNVEYESRALVYQALVDSAK